MYKIHGILVLNLIAMLDCGYVFDWPWSSKTVKSESATEEDVKSLAAISTEQALPIILHGTENDIDLWFPRDLIQAKIKNGRLVSGTEFYAQPTRPQIFFCPNSDEKENCLVPTKFKRLQALECEQEPLNVIEKTPHAGECGTENRGTSMRSVFNLCPAKEPYKFKKTNFVTYTFCYDESAKKTLFVHYILTSIKLNAEKLLSREREVQFTLNKALIADNPVLLEAATKYESQYTLQKLVPTEDFPLITWRRTTHQVVNIALQHRKLVELWNTINEYVRGNAIRMADEVSMVHQDRGYRKIITGVFDIPENEISSAKASNQMNNIWVKIVYYTTYNIFATNKGIAILMNNFIEESPVEKSPDNKQYIDKICPKDTCTSRLKEKFAEVGGQVRCCKVNDAILNLFSMSNIEMWIGLPLPILNINVI